MKHETKQMLGRMIILTVCLCIAMILMFILYRYQGKAWMLATAITLLTFFYHFAMRLVVGESITLLYKDKEFSQEKYGFHLFAFEDGLYKKLKVKEWKKNTITAKPEQFDMQQIKPEELLHNVMQAELIHRIIMVLSFVPLLFIIPFGEPVVFILTSIAACILDMIFVIIQRYNRPRVIKYVELMKRRASRNKTNIDV